MYKELKKYLPPFTNMSKIDVAPSVGEITQKTVQ